MQWEPKPTWEPLALRCAACDHEFGSWQPSNVVAAVWIAAARAHRCRKCPAGPEHLVIIQPSSEVSA